VHFISIFRELERACLSYKKLKRIAKERNENLCAEFIARMAQYDPTELGFVDECRGWGRDLHGFCGFVFLIFAVVIFFFFMTLSLLFNLDVIFTTGIKAAVVIKQAFVFLIDILSAGGVTPSLPLIEAKNPQMLEAN
ncbi:hypothetical protein M405DRAFT_810523, partial [Rhizopogon salebrosus TDB-379]